MGSEIKESKNYAQNPAEDHDDDNLCMICSKTFALRSDLERHIRIHTGEKHYTCKVCQKTFSLGQTLKTHMKMHAGMK